MIRTVFHIAVLRLWNNKQELLLALVVPVLFFSIFALIFDRGVATESPAIKIAIIDDDHSPLTKDITKTLGEQDALQNDVRVMHTDGEWPLEKLARFVIQERSVDVVIYFPKETEQNIKIAHQVSLQLLGEGTNPVSRQIVSAMLSQAFAAAAATSVKRHPGDDLPDRPGTEAPLSSSVAAQDALHGSPEAKSGTELISIDATEVFAADKRNPKIAMYAAGIAVMFLLFSASGAGGSLLEEYEAGTLDRLLSSRLSVTQLLAGKWLFITCLGCVQLTVMFLWAQFAFGVDLLGHVPGFAVMTIATSAATASLALCLAVLCRSRAQLNGVSIVLILTMSALGGSMVPRYIMSEEMQRWGQFTFNAWALDGFKKVFWYDLPLSALNVELCVLLAMAGALACVARIYADRWEAT